MRRTILAFSISLLLKISSRHDIIVLRDLLFSGKIRIYKVSFACRRDFRSAAGFFLIELALVVRAIEGFCQATSVGFAQTHTPLAEIPVLVRHLDQPDNFSGEIVAINPNRGGSVTAPNHEAVSCTSRLLEGS